LRKGWLLVAVCWLVGLTAQGLNVKKFFMNCKRLFNVWNLEFKMEVYYTLYVKRFLSIWLNFQFFDFIKEGSILYE